MPTPLRAVVVNAKRNGLGVIRSLGSAGILTYAVDDSPIAPGLQSRFVTRGFVVSDVQADEDGFIRDMKRVGEAIAKEGERPFLFPVNDEYILPLVGRWSELEHLYRPTFVTDIEDLLTVLDKDRMHDLALDLQMPVPRTVHSRGSLVDVDRLSLPVIVKPTNKKSRDGQEKGVFRLARCETREQVQEAVRELDGLGIDYVAQEFIPGGDDMLYTVGVMAHEGKTHAAFTGRKLRQFPPQNGQCSLGEALPAPAALALAMRFVKAASFTGIAQIEFKLRDGVFYFIEINPRSWSWNSLSTGVGVNLPAVACQVLADQPPDQMVVQDAARRRWHYFDTDLVYNFILNRNVGFRTIVGDALAADDHAFWRADDGRPAVVALLDTLVGKIFRRRTSAPVGERGTR